MNENFQNEYRAAREGGFGFYEQPCGLIEVSGSEAVMFLNGLITNDVKALADNLWMAAAFPNAQGRLLALVRVLRLGDRFLFETDEITYQKVLTNLSRFTMAGDFKVNDLTQKFVCLSLRGKDIQSLKSVIPSLTFPASENEVVTADFNGENIFIVNAFRGTGFDILMPKSQLEDFTSELRNSGGVLIDEETREVLRIENGEPKYAVDMDETTVVLETGLDDAVSFKKGCYIGQEIIARIHFRGHVAKKLTGLILENEAQPNDELKSIDDKNAGRITSIIFSPKLEKYIALGLVRYDYLTDGTELKVNGSTALVKNLPFFE